MKLTGLMAFFLYFCSILFFVLCPCIIPLPFLLSQSQAGIFSKEKKPEEIVKKYGEAVVLITPSDKDGKPLGVGSGFIADPNGIVVTNYHCISDAVTAWIRLTNGAHYEVEGVLGIDKAWDIAVLKIKAKNLPSAPIGDSDKLSAGERVIAIGNPLGLENTVSEGIISALRGPEGTASALIQFTAPISPGSSGGPLFNTKGQVVGVTTLYLTEGQLLNFAVPINLVKPLLKGRKLVALTDATKETKTVSPPAKLQKPSESPSRPSTPSEEAVVSESERHFRLGVSFAKEGKLDSAISEFQEVIRLKPDFAEAHYNLGLAYNQKGLYDLAIRQYEEAIRLKPDFAEAYYLLGRAYEAKGLYDLEIRQYEEAIRLKPDFAEAHYNLGVTYGRKGQYDLAIRHVEQAVRIKPDYKKAHDFLDDLYQLRGR